MDNDINPVAVTGTGTLPEGNTLLSSIQFYSGVKLDPKEERWYVKNPPANFDYVNGKISDYWSRAEFEKEVLEPYEVKKLAIPESMFQNPGKQIYHPYPLSDFILTNVNFVKVTNRDENGEKIFYGFINSSTYNNDGVTIIDWTVSEFYTNLFNGIKFNFAQISRAHNVLSKDRSKIDDDVQYRIKENLSAGSTLIPQEHFDILPDDKKYVRFWVCEIYISGASQIGGIDTIDIGYPSSRAYIVIPFDHNRSGVALSITDQNGNNMGQDWNGKTLGEILRVLSNDESWQSQGISVGQMGITYTVGGDFQLDNADNPKRLTFKTGKLEFTTLDSKDYKLPVLYKSGVAKPIIREGIDGDTTSSLYQLAMRQIFMSSSGQQIQEFFNARGGVPEKLSHYVGFNFLDGDSLIGSFTLDEVQGSVNDKLRMKAYSSPHQFSRLDLKVEPYTVDDENVTYSTSALMRKFVNQRNSSVPFAKNAWATYSFLNQNQMQNAKNVINTSQGITNQQNKFNNDQTRLAAAQTRDRVALGNTQSMEMTTQSANQQQGLAQVGAAIDAGGNALGGMVNGWKQGGLSGAVAGGIGGGAAGGLNQAGALIQADLIHGNTLANQGLANRQNAALTNLSTNQQIALADNTLNFGNKIAAQTAQMKRESLQAGWNDMKLQPATVVSGGSEAEYLAHMFWDFPTGVASLPTASVLFQIGRYLMEYGNSVNIYDYLQKYMFTRKVVNFLRTDDCSIAPSSNIENSVRIQLETAFDRGVQIWHDLDKMAAMDYTGNDYR